MFLPPLPTMNSTIKPVSDFPPGSTRTSLLWHLLTVAVNWTAIGPWGSVQKSAPDFDYTGKIACYSSMYNLTEACCKDVGSIQSAPMTCDDKCCNALMNNTGQPETCAKGDRTLTIPWCLLPASGNSTLFGECFKTHVDNTRAANASVMQCYQPIHGGERSAASKSALLVLASMVVAAVFAVV